MDDRTRQKILIVDDEKLILQTLSSMLMENNYHVEAVSTADDACRLASEKTFDIAFIDQFLGLCRGIDLVGRMSEICPEMYCVMITGCADTDLAVEALKKGAVDFITKPFSLGCILKSIEHANRKRELDRERKKILFTLEKEIGEKTKELQLVYFSVLSSLAETMEKKDQGTHGHSRRVAHYSKLIAASLDLNTEDRINLKASALLHDIGKIGISDFILGKNGPLNEDEMNVVRSHPQKGVEILRPIKQFQPLLPAIFHHHEYYDGTGYPGGLSGENIPLLARIITVADTYDSILSERPYRSGKDHESALKELKDYAGRQFDPVIVDAFINADTRYRQLFATMS